MKAAYTSPVQVRDFPANQPIEEQIKFCCQYGALAPSVHNQQPWSISIAGKQLVVSVYNKVHTKDSDATGRQTWISIGCFVENVLQAADACGMKAKITKQDYSNNAIAITFTSSQQTLVDQRTLSSMESRVSNRNPYKPAKLNAKQLQALNNAQSDLVGVQLVVRTDSAMLTLMTELTRQAIALALSMPKFKRELGQTFHSNISHNKTGIPGHALGYGLLRSIIEPFRFTHMSIAPKESIKESNRVKASAGFVFITSSGDIAKYWFQAGRLYERAALLLCEFGLSQATTAATVEAPDFHQEIEKQIGTANRLQAVIRFGKSDKYIAPSPRLSVEQLFTSNASRD